MNPAPIVKLVIFQARALRSVPLHCTAVTFYLGNRYGHFVFLGFLLSSVAETFYVGHKADNR